MSASPMNTRPEWSSRSSVEARSNFTAMNHGRLYLCLACTIGTGAAAAYQRPVSEKIRIVSNIAVPMRDGIKLYADLYRPVRDGRFPVVIVRTPYGKQRDGIHETKVLFAQHGYAVLVQDTRGRYESGGEWDPFRNEAWDGYDTVEWAARQPWSNGKVGMSGGS